MILVRLRALISNTLFRQISDTFLTRLIGIALGFGASVIISRILGPEGRGRFAAAACLGAIGVQFGNLGLPAANTYYVARDRRKLPAAVGNALWVSFVLGGLGALIAFWVFSVYPRSTPVVGPLLWLGLLGIPFGLCLLLLQNLLLPIEEVRAFNRLELTHKVLALLMMLCLIPLGWISAESILGVGLLASLIVSCCTIAVMLQHLEHRRPQLSFAAFRHGLHYGLKAYWAALFGFLVIRSDLLMVHMLAGPRQSGLYSIAATCADFLMMLPIVIGSLLFPRLSQLTSRAAQWKLTSQTLKTLTPTMLFGLSLCTVLAEPLIRAAYGRPFAPASSAVLWLLPGILAMSVNTILMNCFAAQGMPLITVYSPLSALVLNVLLNLWLIPLWGIRGAAISSSISYGLMLVLSAVYILGQRTKESR
jgi:O-antigen/teichoic acid export membrane protein